MVFTEKPSGKLKIHVENDRLIMYGTPNESSGCVLRGALVLKLNHPTSLKSLMLNFYGTVNVSWTQLFGSGHEKKRQDQKILIDHTWTYLSPQSDLHLLEAGHHSYEFELVLPGNLPESIQVAGYYIAQYQLKAVAERSGFLLPNYTCRREVHISRQRVPISIDYLLDPIIIANQWAGKVGYEISIPSKVFHHGDTITLNVQAIVLAPQLRVRFISCVFKEYMLCRAINGWFNGKNKTFGRIIQYLRKEVNEEVMNEQLWSHEIVLKVPRSLLDIQCDASNEAVKVKHRLKFTMSIENIDGHVSELRAVLPVTISMTNPIGGLPSYNEIWRTLPYDPVLMMRLIQQSNENSNSLNEQNITHLLNEYSQLGACTLPSYNSIYDESIDEDVDSRISALPAYAT